MGSLVLDVMIKGTLALVATGAIVAALRGASAATRHAVWTMGMAAALALPVLSRLLPGWDVAMLPAGPARPVGAAAGSVPAGFDAGAVLALVWGWARRSSSRASSSDGSGSGGSRAPRPHSITASFRP